MKTDNSKKTVTFPQTLYPSGDFPLMEIEDIKGGLHSVESLVDLESMLDNVKEVGMLAYVKEVNTYYRLEETENGLEWVLYKQDVNNLDYTNPLKSDITNIREALDFLIAQHVTPKNWEININNVTNTLTKYYVNVNHDYSGQGPFYLQGTIKAANTSLHKLISYQVGDDEIKDGSSITNDINISIPIKIKEILSNTTIKTTQNDQTYKKEFQISITTQFENEEPVTDTVTCSYALVIPSGDYNEPQPWQFEGDIFSGIQTNYYVGQKANINLVNLNIKENKKTDIINDSGTPQEIQYTPQLTINGSVVTDAWSKELNTTTEIKAIISTASGSDTLGKTPENLVKTKTITFTQPDLYFWSETMPSETISGVQAKVFESNTSYSSGSTPKYFCFLSINPDLTVNSYGVDALDITAHPINEEPGSDKEVTLEAGCFEGQTENVTGYYLYVSKNKLSEPQKFKIKQ